MHESCQRGRPLHAGPKKLQYVYSVFSWSCICYHDIQVSSLKNKYYCNYQQNHNGTLKVLTSEEKLIHAELN